ncbi:MAG: hypothetical protein ACRCT8_08030 [Lacipirellulaceae bacterium]
MLYQLSYLSSKLYRSPGWGDVNPVAGKGWVMTDGVAAERMTDQFWPHDARKPKFDRSAATGRRWGTRDGSPFWG